MVLFYNIQNNTSGLMSFFKEIISLFCICLMTSNGEFAPLAFVVPLYSFWRAEKFFLSYTIFTHDILRKKYFFPKEMDVHIFGEHLHKFHKEMLVHCLYAYSTHMYVCVWFYKAVVHNLFSFLFSHMLHWLLFVQVFLMDDFFATFPGIWNMANIRQMFPT